MFDLNTEEEDSRVRHVVLLITHDCNLRCKYCYESFKEAVTMRFETARSIVEKELKKLEEDSRFSQIEIACLGGEPLLNFDLIKELVEWSECVDKSNNYFFSVRTNGTLLTEEIKGWLIKHRKLVRVGLSLDGLSEMNVANRTSDGIDVDFFVKNWPSERVRLTLFPDSIGYLAKTVRELNDKRIPFVVVPAEGVVWTPAAVECYADELTELSAEYMTNYQEAVDSGLFPYDPYEYFQNKNDSPIPYCGSFGNIVCYDADGIDYPCHIFSPITIGKERAMAFRAESATLQKVKIDSVCAGCEIRTVCKPCFGFHYKIAGDVGVWTERDTICRLRKMLAMASAEFYLLAMGGAGCRQEVGTREEYVRTAMALRMVKTKGDGHLL